MSIVKNRKTKNVNQRFKFLYNLKTKKTHQYLTVGFKITFKSSFYNIPILYRLII